MSRLSVSIVIPAYNEERHLPACLDAIARQTVMPIEVIVVDNNSNDKTAEIAARYPFVRVVRERRQGRVFARNAGFDAARGVIIGRIDADIIMPDHWVAYVQQFYSEPAHRQQAWTGRGFFYNLRFARLASLAYGLLAFDVNRLFIGHPTLWGSNMAITRDQWRAVRSTVHLRNDIHEDLDLALHVADAGYGITYDRVMQTRARLKRVHSDRGELWGYLLWWPRTLQLHGKKAWPVVWFFGALLLYVAAYGLACAEWLARHIRKRLPTA